MVKFGSVRVLSALAFFSVLALLITSDFSEPYATSISRIAPGSDEVRLVCVFISAKQGADGWTLVLRDSQDQQVRGFVANGVVGTMPLAGTIVEVTADLSWEDGLFLFVKGVRPVRV
ncbi:MAG: hypothetical protein ABR879_08470 [Methanomassiliicoccales archaeon]